MKNKLADLCKKCGSCHSLIKGCKGMSFNESKKLEKAQADAKALASQAASLLGKIKHSK